jgi:predicted kinase
MVGFPGAGKTTTAKLVSNITGAAHLWADQERHKMFPSPTHKPPESHKLYDHLNDVTDSLLSEGKSVVFDTNFNFYKDRERLRQIAASHGANTIILWLTTSKDIAKQRSVHERTLRNNYEYILPESEFERMSNHLQSPRPDEAYIKLDGTKITPQYIKAKLNLN